MPTDANSTDRKPLQNFNPATMSGIYPGSRTMTYQRLRLHRQGEAEQQSQGQWFQLQWYSEPTAAILQPMDANKPSIPPTITLIETQLTNFTEGLHEELREAGLEADACFICRHWQPLAVHNDDGLPAGRCRWNDGDTSLPSALATQSALSLACAHLQRLDSPQVSALDKTASSINHPRVLKSAELDPDRLPFWPRLWQRIRPSSHSPQVWADQIIERSGVGAGTEPCFVCQGRLANLGAMAVASPEGDKQTFSIWRCRSCYTTYFNDWTDRWERLDNLETEERYFRIAPAEAYAALRIVHATKGGEHPGRREDRSQQRAQMLALIAGKQPLSHQIRQGR
jgi:hypothetical protein